MIKFLLKNDNKSMYISRQKNEIDKLYIIAHELQKECMTNEEVKIYPKTGTHDLFAIHKELDILGVHDTKYRIIINRLKAISSLIEELKHDLKTERDLRAMADGIIEEYKQFNIR